MIQNELKKALSKLPPGDVRYFDLIGSTNDEALAGSREQRQQIIWRTDSGLGTDAKINWALTHDYQVLVKGYNGKRAIVLPIQAPENFCLKQLYCFHCVSGLILLSEDRKLCRF